MVPIEGYLLPSAVMTTYSRKHTFVRHDASLTSHPQPFRTLTARSRRTQYNHHTFFTHRLISDPSILPFIAVSLHVDRTLMCILTHTVVSPTLGTDRQIFRRGHCYAMNTISTP